MHDIKIQFLQMSTGVLIFNGILFTLFLILLFKIVERIYFKTTGELMYTHCYVFKKDLPLVDKAYLEANFEFYQRLPEKYKKYFIHRVATFIAKKEFIGRDGFKITREVELLLASTAVMLTFGMRHYKISSLERFIIYPSVFYSQTNNANHKGEFNPKLKALVFSWEDFMEGYRITDDNLNLGIHEITHAIHINSMLKKDLSSKVFKKSFSELVLYLSKNEAIRKSLIDSQYLRAYAFTNQFEFLAVIIETFIETPKEFKDQFPGLYQKVKDLLKFNFLNY